MKKLIHTLCAVGAVLALSACVVTPPSVRFTPPAVVMMAPIAPPPPRVEVIAAPPGHEYFWVYGHWRWDGREHQWQDGHWEKHHEHEHWVNSRWSQGERGQWQLQEGHWRPD
jgi:hypothetical protein